MAGLVFHARSIHLKKNGFSRRVLATRLLDVKSINLGNNSYYFAGYTSHNFYLGNYTAPLRLFKSDPELEDTQTFFLRVPKEIRADWPVSRISVDSPELYLTEGNSPFILEGPLQKHSLNEIFSNDLRFTKSLIIAHHSFVLRSFDGRDEKNILTRISANNPVLISSKQLLIKQVDGFFCTDGQLLFDKVRHHVLYLYYYRNQIVLSDTNLVLLSPITTIDTNRFAKIVVGSVPKQRLSTMVSIGSTVNKMAAIFSSHLFVWSQLVADNEDRKQFETNTVFDSYSLINRQYEGSFYIPTFRNLKPSGFAFGEKTILGLYQNFLVAYKTEYQFFRE